MRRTLSAIQACLLLGSALICPLAWGQEEKKEGAPAADTETDQRLKYPDVVYFAGDREPLHGKVIEETEKDILFEAVLPGAKATGATRLDRRQIERIEYLEDYCFDRAKGFLDQKDYDNARLWFNRAGKHIGTLPEGHPRRDKMAAVRAGLTQIDFQRASEMKEKGNVDEALSAFEDIYKQDKAWPGLQKAVSDTLCSMARDLMRKDKYEDARAAVRRLLALYPSDGGGATLDQSLREHYADLRRRAEARLAEARALAARERYKEAISAVLESITLDSDTPGARGLLEEYRTKFQVLRYGDYEFPASLNPLVASKMAEKRIAQLLFDGLVDRGDRLESDDYFPRLAAKHVWSPDNLVHTFMLADGLRWSDGEPLTSADVAFTIHALRNPKGDGYNRSWASWIKSLETPDPHTVKIIFERPACRPVALLAFKIVPRHKFTDEVPRRKCEFSLSPVGCGPFALAGATGEEEIVLKRNEQFRLKPRLNEVALKRYYDRLTAFTDFTRGDLELITQLEPLQVDQLRKLGESKFVVKSHEARTVYFLAMNFRKKIFQEHDFRKAVVSAIDRRKIIVQHFRGELEGGLGHRLITGPFPTGSWAYNDGKNPNMPVPDYPFSTDMAKGLVAGLKERGLGPLMTVSIKFPADDIKVERACVEMCNELKDAGIEAVALKRQENDLHNEVYGQGDFDLVYASYSFDDTMDASPLFDFEQIGPSLSNFSAYKNADLSAIFAEIRKSPDPQRIKDLSWEVHAVVARDLAIIPLWQLDNYVAFKASVKGVKVHPFYLFAAPEEWYIAE